MVISKTVRTGNRAIAKKVTSGESGRMFKGAVGPGSDRSGVSPLAREAAEVPAASFGPTDLAGTPRMLPKCHAETVKKRAKTKS